MLQAIRFRFRAVKPWVVFVVAAFLHQHGAGAWASDIKLAFPVRCEIGRNCFVQNYVDHGAAGAPRDFRCAARTYGGHTGTDIRISKLALGKNSTDVLAAAPGTVVSTRDGMEDVPVRAAGLQALAGKECGNGVVVQHDGAWQTQYCHMAKGSVLVTKAQQVQAGSVLGRVGLSGQTEFFHLHFAVRHGSDVADPFAYEAPAGTCHGGRSLWADHDAKLLQYRDTELMNFGFSDVAPTMENIETGDLARNIPTRQSPALVAFARAIGLEGGDEQELVLKGPDQMLLAQYRAPALPNNKAQYLIIAGKKRGKEIWQPGSYEGRYSLRRRGEEILVRAFTLDLE